MSEQTSGTPADIDAYYGAFSTERDKEVLDVPLRLIAAWTKNDGYGVAKNFTEDGILILPGDVFKKGRDAVGAFMTAAYAGPFKGTGVTGQPVDLRYVSDTVALLRTHGGIIAPGETAIDDELAVRSTWVIIKADNEWQLAVYQNSPRGSGATLRW